MEIITNWTGNHLASIVPILMLLLLVILIVFAIMNVRFAKLNRRYETMMRGMENANIEAMLLQHVSEVRDASQKMDRLAAECLRLREQTQVCVQKVGIVRFNAFENTGSDLSFAVALLDADNNGVVISSIFGRNESRTYAKPIQTGKSTYFLSEEEQAALRQAQQDGLKSRRMTQ